MYSDRLYRRATQLKIDIDFNRRGRRIPIFASVTTFLLLYLIWTYSDRVPTTLQGWQVLGSDISKKGFGLATQGGGLIPNKIWQIQLPKHAAKNQRIDPEGLSDTASWLALNPDFSYTLVDQEGADHFIDNNFADHPVIIETYHNITNVGQKSDFLRYLLLYIEGGVYTDTDTEALRPINEWVPPDIKDKVKLIVGIEFDRRDGGPWADIPHWLQFCQWTIAAAPRHPVFRRMFSHVIDSLEELSEHTPNGKTQPTSFEVMTSTGPAAWTEAVFAQLQEYNPSLNETKDLSFMTEPTLYGDVLVLTIDGFGMGQPHSHSTNDGTTPKAALMKHKFRGSWRGD